MSTIEIITSVVSVLAVTSIAWLYSQQRRHHRLSDAHREWIDEALSSIGEEVSRKREHSNAVAKADVDATFSQLTQLIEHQPGEIITDVEEMQRLWTELDTVLDDYGGHLPSDETELTTLKARALKIADRIEALADDIRRGLE
ncbi:MAG TPA: hypothetical protein VJ998_11315 [Pseudomonadales bacterium]|nr:hypothetical protein [Pseudomonadales bacterium]